MIGEATTPKTFQPIGGNMDSKELNGVKEKYVKEEQIPVDLLSDDDLDCELIEHWHLEIVIAKSKNNFATLARDTLKLVKARREELIKEKDSRLKVKKA